MNVECNYASYEVLRTILDHEHIPFTTAYGPKCLVIVIEKPNMKRFKTAVTQWLDSITDIAHQI